MPFPAKSLYKQPPFIIRMVHSFPDYIRRASMLEEMLVELPFSGEACIDLLSGNDGENQHQTPFYMLPVNSIEGMVYGILPAGGELEEARIGFQRRRPFAIVNYFEPTPDGRIEGVGFDENTLYLPVVPTGHLVKIGRRSEPFPVMGIDGSNGIYPLLLASKTEEGMQYKGLYYGRRGMAAFDCAQFSGNIPPAASIASFLRGAEPCKKKKAEGAKALPSDDAEIDWNEPISIVQYLDKYVVGQEHAKKVLAVAFSNYMARMNSGKDDLPVEQLLLLGSTGVGKSYTASLIAKKAGLPYAHTTLSAKSAEGYRGHQLSAVFRKIKSQTKSESPYGVVFFDEIDKTVWSGGEPDSFGPKLIDELIAWLGGTIVQIEGGMGEDDSFIDTSSLLFISAGAFQDNGTKQSLADFVEKRRGRKEKVVGFGAESSCRPKAADYSILHHVMPDDLIAYGLKAELIGRLTTIGVFNHLTLEDKVRILTTAKDSVLERYKNLLGIRGYKADIDMGTIQLIAQRCPAKTGARALNAVCSDLFLEVLFEPKKYADSSNLIHITKELAEQLARLYK